MEVKEVTRKNKGLTHKVELPQFEVLKNLQNGFSVTEISKYRKTSRQAVYKILSSLLKKGMITKIKTGVYELTQSGIEGLHSFVAIRYSLRQHNLHFKIKILSSLKNWDKQRHKLIQLPYFNKRISLKNNEQELFNFGKVKVRTTTQSVIIQVPTIYSKTTEEAIIQSFDCLYEIIPKIEKLFKICLVKDYKANITIISQEYASINDSLAKVYRKEGNQLMVTDDLGKIWMITDFSFSNDETEFIDSNRSSDDTDNIIPTLNFLRKNPNHLIDQKELVNQLASIQMNQSKNLEEFAVALNRHIPVYEGMARSAEANATSVELLASVVKDLKEEIKILTKKIEERK